MSLPIALSLLFASACFAISSFFGYNFCFSTSWPKAWGGGLWKIRRATEQVSNGLRCIYAEKNVTSNHNM